LTVTTPDWPGVIAALDAVAESDRARRLEREADIARERESYRQLLALATVYEAGLPLKLLRPAYCPNYGKGDDEAERLWREVQTKNQNERATKILAADAALGDEPAAHVTPDGVSEAARLVLDAAQVYRDSRYVQDPVPPRANAIMAEKKRQDQERAAAEKVREESLEHDARTWAAEHGWSALGRSEIQRAAREGRRVRGAITARCTELFRLALELSIPEYATIVESYAEEDRDDVPSAEAYATHDAVKAEGDAFTLPPGLAVETSDVCRIDVARRGSAVWRTGVLLTARHPWFTKDIEIAVISEPLCEEEES
jgi:hypothetical protein